MKSNFNIMFTKNDFRHATIHAFGGDIEIKIKTAENAKLDAAQCAHEIISAIETLASKQRY